ncbi:MAG: glycosyltransferase family 4 protein [Candidatus Omnitrophica bacterium]|nr:glycosyltransferase family 4 protein [Candidatus Omnitrophota bacterium]
MRVLLLSNWLPPIQSGSSYYASSLAHALIERGHEVAAVTLDWGPKHAPSANLPYAVQRLPVWKIPKLPFFYNLELMGFSFTPRNVAGLCDMIRAFKPDIVHHVNHIFDSTFLSTVAARRTGVPIVGSITTPIQHQTPWKQRILEWADRFTVGKFGVARWDGIVSLDHVAHDYVGKLYGPEAQSRSRIIPFGVQMESLPLYELPAQIQPGRPQILMVGHIHPFRNPVQLVRAMPCVLKEVPDARLVLAGRVDLKEPVEAARDLGLGPDQVSFLGETDHRQIIDLMKTSSVFSSWVTGPYPGLGTAAVEAMLCRLPVVNDLPENLFGEGKLRNGDNIVLANSRDTASISAALIRLLKDGNLRRRIGEAGREFVLQHLSWQKIAAEMEQFYQAILEPHRPKKLLDVATTLV